MTFKKNRMPGAISGETGRFEKEEPCIGQIGVCFEKLVGRIPIPILRMDSAGAVLFANSAASDLLEKDNGKKKKLPANLRRRLIASFENQNYETVEITLAGKKYAFHPVPETETDMFQIWGMHVNEQSKCLEDRLLRDGIFQSAREGIVITDPFGAILDAGRSFIEDCGYNASDLIGKKIFTLECFNTRPGLYDKILREIGDQGVWTGVIMVRKKNGEPDYERISVSQVKNDQGTIIRHVFVLHDIFRNRKNGHIAENCYIYHDVLTGLPTRGLCNDRLERALANARRNSGEICIMTLDLDKFRTVNESLGYSAGDELLLEAAKRLKTCCRNEDTICRLGGDEFTLIFPNIKIGGRDAVRIAERIVDTFETPFFIGGQRICVTSSIGISLYPTDGDDVESLLKYSDMAMRQAKEQGGNSFRIYTESLNMQVQHRIQLENNLQRALERNEFRVFYQPKVDIRTGEVSGAEALVRWLRNEKDLVPPNEFIPIAEDTGLIFSIGEWVLRTACCQTKAWRDSGYPLTVAVNISAKQFQDKNLQTMVFNVLEETDFPPECLNLELTENIVMRDVNMAIKTMEALKRVGIRFSVDDFGTGYSSLSYLSRFPLNVLKIDKSFVKFLPHRKGDAAIANAILSLAKSLVLEVVAEGVETPEQLLFMKERGCEKIQGFLFSKPLPPEEFTRILENGKRLDSDIYKGGFTIERKKFL